MAAFTLLTDIMENLKRIYEHTNRMARLVTRQEFSTAVMVVPMPRCFASWLATPKIFSFAVSSDPSSPRSRRRAEPLPMNRFAFA